LSENLSGSGRERCWCEDGDLENDARLFLGFFDLIIVTSWRVKRADRGSRTPKKWSEKIYIPYPGVTYKQLLHWRVTRLALSERSTMSTMILNTKLVAKMQLLTVITRVRELPVPTLRVVNCLSFTELTMRTMNKIK